MLLELTAIHMEVYDHAVPSVEGNKVVWAPLGTPSRQCSDSTWSIAGSMTRRRSGNVPKLLRSLSFPTEVEIRRLSNRFHLLKFWPACLWQGTGVVDASKNMHRALPPDDSWLESLQCPICLVSHFPNHLSVIKIESAVECCLLITAVVINMHSIGQSDVISETLTALFLLGLNCSIQM